MEIFWLLVDGWFNMIASVVHEPLIYIYLYNIEIKSELTLKVGKSIINELISSYYCKFYLSYIYMIELWIFIIMDVKYWIMASVSTIPFHYGYS